MATFDDDQFRPFHPHVGYDLATAWKQDAEYAVPVVSPVGNGPKGDAFTFDDFTPEQLYQLRSEARIVNGSSISIVKKIYSDFIDNKALIGTEDQYHDYIYIVFKNGLILNSDEYSILEVVGQDVNKYLEFTQLMPSPKTNDEYTIVILSFAIDE